MYVLDMKIKLVYIYIFYKYKRQNLIFVGR